MSRLGVFMYSAVCLTLQTTVVSLPVLPYSVQVPEIPSHQNSGGSPFHQNGGSPDGMVPAAGRLISSLIKQTNIQQPHDNSGTKTHKSSIITGAQTVHAPLWSAQLPSAQKLPSDTVMFPSNTDAAHSRISSKSGESPPSHSAHSSNTFNSNSFSSDSENIRKHFKNVVNNDLSEPPTQERTRNSGKLQYKHDDRYKSVDGKVLKLNPDLNLKHASAASRRDVVYQEYTLPTEYARSLQLAVKDDDTAARSEDSKTLLTISLALAALFCLGVFLGLFGCCCPKKQPSTSENGSKNNGQVTAGETRDNKLTIGQTGGGGQMTADNKKPSQVFNPSDIPTGDEDLDDPISVKDKIRALDQKLLIQPSPDPNKRKSRNNDLDVKRRSQNNDVALKRKSQNNDIDFSAIKRKSQNPDFNLIDDKGTARQPLLTPDDDVVLRDKTDQSKSKSLADNISKSDTQDDVSDKIFDNISTHSSISQPNNPDVVIADSDDDDDFAQLQRGTVILKSFQRAKPPRNRSPATRTSKGKIRKSRANLDNSRSRDSPSSGPRSRDTSKDRDQTSTPSSLSLGTSSKTNSLETRLDKNSNKNSPEAAADNNSNTNKVNNTDKRMENPMARSDDFLDFDSIMNKSVTSIGSDIVIQKKHESPTSVRYTKTDSPKSDKHMKKDSPKSDKLMKNDSPKSDRYLKKDSPKSERDIRNGSSPARNLRTKESETKDKEKRTESPSRFKKSKDSPVDKRKNRRKEREKESRNFPSDAMSTSLYEPKAPRDEEKRLSGIPAGVNNIFYLIDPTVKKKCKSVENIIADKKQKRKSGDYNNDEPKVSKHKAKEENGSPTDTKSDASTHPVKRDRTHSDPSRQKGVVEQTPL